MHANLMTACDLHIPPSNRSAIRRNLLRWYARSSRDLPWRRCQDDPYAVWLSESMLQQTQAATVVPYFQRFMAQFPTVEALAKAPRDEVLALWAGLGYYRRAHALHEAAALIANDMDGRFPDTVEDLLRLPGVGRYTAGAVASIAFDRRAPILDGNVARVLSRVFAQRGAPDTPNMQRRLWSLAKTLLPRRRCGEFNQAVMELGATVCTPKGPACGRCPIKAQCAALRDDLVAVIPSPKRRAAVRRLVLHTFVVQSSQHLLLIQRPPRGLWAGMWAFPTVELDKDQPADAARAVLPASLTDEIDAWVSIGTVRHTLTHRKVELRILRAGVPKKRIRPPFRWHSSRDAAALPQAFAKVLALHEATVGAA